MTAPRYRFDIRRAARPLLVLLAVWTVAVVAFHMLVARPEIVAYVELSEGSREALDALRKDEQNVEARESYLAALEQAELDLATLRTDVLSTREQRFVEVQSELARLCRQFNIDLDSVVFDNPLLIDQGLDRSEMTVPLEGGYENLRRFLQAVEASETFLVVERVALGESAEGGESVLQLNVTLVTYFQLPEGLRRKAPVRGRTRGGRA